MNDSLSNTSSQNYLTLNVPVPDGATIEETYMVLVTLRMDRSPLSAKITSQWLFRDGSVNWSESERLMAEDLEPLSTNVKQSQIQGNSTPLSHSGCWCNSSDGQGTNDRSSDVSGISDTARWLRSVPRGCCHSDDPETMKFTDKTRHLIQARAQHRCELCGTAIRTAGQIHHRKARGMGGTKNPESKSASNGLYVHLKCHAKIEQNRSIAYDNGWLVHNWDSSEDSPVLMWDGWKLLNSDGTLTPVSSERFNVSS